MKERLENIKIAKVAKSKPDTEAETIKADIIRTDGEIRELKKFATPLHTHYTLIPWWFSTADFLLN